METSSFTSSQLLGLSETPVIYIAECRVLAKPSMVVLDMSNADEVHPYLFKASLGFGEYYELFHKLGASWSLTCDHYARILETIYNTVEQEEPLHAGELSMILKSVQKLFSLIQRPDTSKTLTVSKLFLPSSEKKLVSCTELVFKDDTWLADRIKNLPGLQYFLGFSGLEMTVHDPLKEINYLPKSVRPLMLSKIITERVSEDIMNTRTETAKARRLLEFFESVQLLHGILRLIKHERYRKDQTFPEEEQKEIKESLCNVGVFEVDNLNTHLFMNGQALDNTERSRDLFLESVFVTRGDQQSEIFSLYFADSDGRNLSEWMCTVDKQMTNYINKCIGHKLGDTTMYLNDVLKCIGSPDRIQSILDSSHIVTIDTLFIVEAEFIPHLGSEIPLELHHLLDNSFQCFEKGEYVAFEVYDPIVDEGDESSTDNDDSDVDKMSAVYILARIVEVIDMEENVNVLEMTYTLDTGNDAFETVNSSRIYKFVRKSSSSSGALDFIDGSYVQNWNMDGVKKYILHILRNAVGKPRTERKRIIKRLLLQYHPDKHQDNKEYFNQLTKFILFLVSKIENGESLDEIDGFDTDSLKTSPSTPFWENVNRRGARYAKQRSTYGGNASSSSFFDSCRSRGPQPGQSRRWIRQAKYDLDAASHDMVDERSCNWVCYKCHQVITHFPIYCNHACIASNLFYKEYCT